MLCVANREGERIDCMKAGIERPLYANRDETGQKVTSYTGVGRPFAIDAKGNNILVFIGYWIIDLLRLFVQKKIYFFSISSYHQFI